MTVFIKDSEHRTQTNIYETELLITQQKCSTRQKTKGIVLRKLGAMKDQGPWKSVRPSREDQD